MQDLRQSYAQQLEQREAEVSNSVTLELARREAELIARKNKEVTKGE
jgi:hypothetical protein